MAGLRIGRFEVLRELGKGGQGIVYLARDPQLDRQVAIKTLHKLGHKTEQLTREARIVSKLQHPNVITLYDYGEDEGGPYLVYAYVEGKTLAQWLKQQKSLPFTRAAEIACGVLDALAYAHAQGISHLDMKPANIMLAANGTPMVMDFGLATTTGDHEQTINSPLSGTPRYVAPEIISGKHGDALSDIYSLGAMLYEMVTGEFAVGGENMYEVLNRAAHEQVTAPSVHNEQIDAKLEGIVLKALHKNPIERYPDALAMSKELKAYLNESRNATLEFLLQRMRSKRDFPAISSVISEVNAIVSSESRSTSQLASVILQDLALTNKILRVVNTAAFGQYGGAINTISKAVAILGFETVRNIAMSLILIELLQNQPQAQHLKEEVVKGILTGVVAARLSAKNDVRDAEEVLVCSMFHSLGKMLSTYYFHEESEEIDLLVRQGESEEAAASRVLGIPYSELGMSVARGWKFPPRLLSGMRHLSSGKVSAPKGELEQLSVTINLAHELCDISVSTDVRHKQKRLIELSERYENTGNISASDLSGALDAGLAEMGDRASSLGISIAGSTLLLRSQQWSGRVLLPVPENTEKDMEGMTPLDMVVAQAFGDGDSSVPLHDPDAVLGAGIQDVTNSMVGEFRLNDVLQMVLETMHRGMSFHRTLFLIRNNKLSNMEARFGLGADINEVIPEFHFSMRFVPDVFHLAVEKGVDISIADIRALNIADKIPAWYLDTVNAPSFVLLPLMLNGKAIGLIYADMLESGRLDISNQQLSLLRALRNQAVLAIKQKM
ncbi:MAG: HDOD domain-containing protein [Gallionella sp.]|nr:HDOD domain-containing protein [Gallionella sp.]